jgi:hypothetical protein
MLGSVHGILLQLLLRHLDNLLATAAIEFSAPFPAREAFINVDDGVQRLTAGMH